MSTTIEIKRKAAGPEGSILSEDQPVTHPRTFKVVFTQFMLEDYLDAVDARAALDNPENAERVSWGDVRGQLGI